MWERHANISWKLKVKKIPYLGRRILSRNKRRFPPSIPLAHLSEYSADAIPGKKRQNDRQVVVKRRRRFQSVECD